MKNIHYLITNWMLHNPILTLGITRILTLTSIFIYVLLSGCSSSPKMVEGTTINLGAYIPFEGNLYGVELISYINGLKVQASSNQAFQVSRTYASTNEWGWGLLKSVEGSKTDVQVGYMGTNTIQKLK